MSKLAAAQALAAQAASTGVDMTEVQKGGGGKLLPAGYALGRLVEYVEYGKQPQEFQGKAKDPLMEIQLGFALWGPGIQGEDGSPYILRPYSIALSRNEKAKAYKLFGKLNWKNTHTHFAQMLGEAFMIPIVHENKSKTDTTQVSRINLDGILPPLDTLSRQPYVVPEARDEDVLIFLWDYPTIEAWNALKIEGTFDDGKSKNRIQETILGATDFAGSPLEQLLMSAGIPALPSTPAAPAAALPSAAPLGQVGVAASPVATPVVPGAQVAGVVGSVPLAQPTPPATAAVIPVAAVVVPAGPVVPTAPIPAAMPTAPTTSPSSPAMPA